MNEKPQHFPIAELRKVSPLEKDLVNRFLQLKSPVSQSIVMDGMQDVPSQPTVSRAISKLVEKGIVIRSGRTKGSRFVLSPDARHFATPPAARPPLAFDPFRIAAYIPNRTRWLPDQMRDRMARAGEGVRGQLDIFQIQSTDRRAVHDQPELGVVSPGGQYLRLSRYRDADPVWNRGRRP